MLDPVQARVRQKRLLSVLAERKLDAVVLGATPHVYYLTAHLPFWQQFLILPIYVHDYVDPKANTAYILIVDPLIVITGLSGGGGGGGGIATLALVTLFSPLLFLAVTLQARLVPASALWTV